MSDLFIQMIKAFEAVPEWKGRMTFKPNEIFLKAARDLGMTPQELFDELTKKVEHGA